MDGSIITFTTNPPASLNDPKVTRTTSTGSRRTSTRSRRTSQYLKKLGVTKVALVTNTTAQFQEYIDAAHQLFPAKGIQIVLEQRYDPTTTDFSSIITKVQQSGAQAVLDFSFGDEATNFYNAAAAANLQIPVLGGYGNSASNLVDGPDSLPGEVGDVRHDDDEPSRPEDERAFLREVRRDHEADLLPQVRPEDEHRRRHRLGQRRRRSCGR